MGSVLSSVKLVGVNMFLGEVSWSKHLGVALLEARLREEDLDPADVVFKVSAMKLVKSSNRAVDLFISFAAFSKDKNNGFIGHKHKAVLARWHVDIGDSQQRVMETVEPSTVLVESFLAQKVLETTGGLMFVGEDLSSDRRLAVMRIEPHAQTDIGKYFHNLHEATSEFETFKVSSDRCRSSDAVSVCSPISVGKSVFPQEEVLFTLSSSFSASSIDGTSRAEVLGDDSVLLKYLNPNIVVVVSKAFPSNSSSSLVDSPDASIVVTVLDGVSAKIIQR